MSGWHGLRYAAALGPTRETAEHDCLAAIAFALEGDPQDYDTDAESLTFDVNVAPAA